MNSRENLARIVGSMEDPRLAMFVISCHVDKPLAGEEPKSVYDIPIQAGAALTDKRICEVNDYDGAADTISDRNQRYGEMTAMYWIGNNLLTDYVGITHYRRRFGLTDEELSGYLDRGFDIITTKNCWYPQTIGQLYRETQYGYDLDLMLSVLEKRAPEYAKKAREVFDWDHRHFCNMNVFRRELYAEYCDLMFPVLDELYQKCSLKTDTYYRRDIGYLSEWFSSVFVEKKKDEGCSVMEAPLRVVKSKEWKPEEECDLGDFGAVYEACRKYFSANNILRCRNLVAAAQDRGGFADSRIRELADLFYATILEQKELPETMLEYLPLQWRKDLDTLREVYVSFGNMVRALSQNPTAETVALYRQFLEMTHFSEIAVRCRCRTLGIRDEEKILKLGKEAVSLPL